jgi:hypothetical protein
MDEPNETRMARQIVEKGQDTAKKAGNRVDYIGHSTAAGIPLKGGALAPRRAAILVLGVGRSGTSVLAHVFNVLGATLPEQLVGPGQGNPLGHWEPIRLLAINEEILQAIGCSRAEPRPIPARWFRSKEAYAFHERLKATITSDYGDAPLILIKEPRICRLAPLYLEVLDSLEIEPLVVIPIRHPVEVILSITERENHDPVTIEFLWLRYLLEAEQASRGCVRVWTSFENVLVNWEQTVQSIADGLGIVWPNSPESVAAEVGRIVQPRHRHYRIANDPAPLSVGPLAADVWQAAQHSLNGNEDVARELFDKINTAIKDLDRLNLPLQERIEGRLAEAETRLAGLQVSETAAREEIARLSEVERELNGRLTSLYASGSWRVAAPLRALQRSIFGR